MNDMFPQHPADLTEQVKEAERELHLRKSVYPRMVQNRKLTPARAERALFVQQAIIDTLKRLQAGQ